MEITTNYTWKDVFTVNWDLSFKGRFTLLKIFIFALFMAIVLSFGASELMDELGVGDVIGHFATVALLTFMICGILVACAVSITILFAFISCIISYFFKSYAITSVKIEEGAIVEFCHGNEMAKIPFAGVQFLMVRSDRIYVVFSVFKTVLIKPEELGQLPEIINALEPLFKDSLVKKI